MRITPPPPAPNGTYDNYQVICQLAFEGLDAVLTVTSSISERSEDPAGDLCLKFRFSILSLIPATTHIKKEGGKKIVRRKE